MIHRRENRMVKDLGVMPYGHWLKEVGKKNRLERDRLRKVHNYLSPKYLKGFHQKRG